MAAALLDTSANVTMLLAIQKWLLSLASILISLYPAATVVLAIILLRERVTRWQEWHGAGNDVGGHDRQRLTSVSFAFVISRNGDLALLSITT